MIIETKVAPFIKLTAMTAIFDDNTKAVDQVVQTGYVYYNITKRPTLIRDAAMNVTIVRDADGEILVKESPEEYCALADEVIDDEQSKKAKQAEEYMAATMARVAETAKKVEGK